MNIFLGIIIGLFSLMLLVILHELGHFIAARRNGVKVNEFGIGFPPRAVAWVKGNDGKWHRLKKTDWKKPQKSLILSLNWLPIGGFCAMEGESDADTRPHTFGAATFWQKTKILFAGVAMNWLVAVIIFTILAWIGMPQFLPNQFAASDTTYSGDSAVYILSVAENSPASTAGLKKDDQILRANDVEIKDVATLDRIIKENPDKDVIYEISREGEDVSSVLVHQNPEGSDYLLGISMGQTEIYSYSTWTAPLVGLGTTMELTGETFRGLGELVGNLFSGLGRLLSSDQSTRESGEKALESVGESVSGPVGILGVLFPAFADSGISNILFLVALISISLACMNVLPFIPALDGGRWLLIAIFRLLKKPLEKKLEEKIVSIAMYIILGLAVLITILDITKIAQ
ncbi:site-2 protease family protein [Candidatus Saccharibacteria bacterium]|nr:site-2 protease family protein [Candidatus Saccharibacteria bacterium]